MSKFSEFAQKIKPTTSAGDNKDFTDKLFRSAGYNRTSGECYPDGTAYTFSTDYLGRFYEGRKDLSVEIRNTFYDSFSENGAVDFFESYLDKNSDSIEIYMSNFSIINEDIPNIKAFSKALCKQFYHIICAGDNAVDKVKQRYYQFVEEENNRLSQPKRAGLKSDIDTLNPVLPVLVSLHKILHDNDFTPIPFPSAIFTLMDDVGICLDNVYWHEQKIAVAVSDLLKNQIKFAGFLSMFTTQVEGTDVVRLENLGTHPKASIVEIIEKDESAAKYLLEFASEAERAILNQVESVANNLSNPVIEFSKKDDFVKAKNESSLEIKGEVPDELYYVNVTRLKELRGLYLKSVDNIINLEKEYSDILASQST